MIERFTRAERLLHWTNAATVFFLLGTGFVIWNDWDRNHRLLGLRYGNVHFWVGITLLLGAPLIFLALRKRRVAIQETRFNLGQRLNIWILGLFYPLLGLTGVVRHYGKSWGLTKSYISPFKVTHLWLAGGVALLVAGHLVMVLRHRHLIQGMLTGFVSDTGRQDVDLAGGLWHDARVTDNQKGGQV